MTFFEHRQRWAGGLIASGLVIELAMSFWIHPLAFMSFALVSCPLVVTGMLMFAWPYRGGSTSRS